MDIEIKGRRLWFLAFVAALGGFLYGYDTAVIAGGEQQIQSGWSLSPFVHGLVMSSALWGTVIGAMCGGKVTDRIGRKPMIFCVGALYLLSAVWSGFAHGPVELIVARFVGGLGVGASSIAVPVYLSEISPAKSRGRICALFQFNIVIGIVMSQVVNWRIGVAGLGDATWRWMLWAEAVPAFVFTVLTPFLLESPRYLAMIGVSCRRSRTMEFPNSAVRLNPTPTPQAFFSRANLRPILLAFFVAAFNMLSGINAVLYYARRFFELAGCQGANALIMTTWMTVILGAGTFVGLFLIDRIGRKQMLILGGAGYVISLFGCAAGFVAGWNGMIVVGLFLFVLSHAIGQGTVIWVFISEVFPQEFRAQGQSLGSSTHWLFNAGITFVIPSLTVWLPIWGIFAIFGGFMVLHLFWAIFIVPETKGKSLEEIKL